MGEQENCGLGNREHCNLKTDKRNYLLTDFFPLVVNESHKNGR